MYHVPRANELIIDVKHANESETDEHSEEEMDGYGDQNYRDEFDMPVCITFFPLAASRM